MSMETVTERNDAAESRGGYAATELESIRPEMTFLSENPESFGLIPDARPLATKYLLIGANGHSAESGEYAPVYEMENVGIDGLFALYGDLLPRTVETVDALETAFGDSRLLQAHPVSRYCATLAELTALQVMTGGAYNASPEQTRLLLNVAVERNLAALRRTLRSRPGDFYCADDYFSVSVGICRILPEGEGNYAVDIFAAGDFRVYLLDGAGMAPLWQTSTPVAGPGRTDAFRTHRVRVHRDGPFALLLLSESVCALSTAETRSLRGSLGGSAGSSAVSAPAGAAGSHPGRIWKYRLRLENYFMRLLTDCVREHEFGERASRFFVGRSHGRDSASGALTLMRNGGSYDDFLTQCQARLAELGRLSEILSDDDKPAETARPETRSEAELAYLRKLLRENVPLSNRLTEALRQCVLHKLEEDGETPPLPGEASDQAGDYVRLSRREVWESFRRYDCENDGDRARIETNRRTLREYLSEHWISLRPYLTSHTFGNGADADSHCRIGDRMYRTCMEMNGRLTDMLLNRSRRILSAETLLSDGLNHIAAEGNDWIYGRADGDRAEQWAESLTEKMAELLASLRSDWRQDTEAYRSLLTAYSAQREALFRHDVRPGLGVFAKDWTMILDGALPESRWALFGGRLTDDPETAELSEMLESLHRISRGTGALLGRIRDRAAESRVARELADKPELRVAALRGAAYEDADWGDAVIAVMDTATRNDFRATVRRWEEARRLEEEKRQAYRRYGAMYTEFTEA